MLTNIELWKDPSDDSFCPKVVEVPANPACGSQKTLRESRVTEADDLVLDRYSIG